MSSKEEEGDVALLDHRGGDAVGKAGELFQAVRVKSPIPENENIEKTKKDLSPKSFPYLVELITSSMWRMARLRS